MNRLNLNKAALREQAVPFTRGSLVVTTLSNPREKFWGMIVALAAEGLSLSGVELASLEDRVLMIREGEPSAPAVVFFPMHRIERIELDGPEGNIPSLADRFTEKTGLDVFAWLSWTIPGRALNQEKHAPVHGKQAKSRKSLTGAKTQ